MAKWTEVYHRYLGAVKARRYNARLVLEERTWSAGPMAMYLEFVVLGPPISNQVPGPNLTAWRATIAGAATLPWPNPPLTVELKAIIANFYAGNRPSLDVDNMSKAILDEMEGIVYNNDRQVVQAELTHVQIGAAFSIVGVRPIIVNAIQTDNQFVYVRIDDAVSPFQLPR